MLKFLLRKYVQVHIASSYYNVAEQHSAFLSLSPLSTEKEKVISFFFFYNNIFGSAHEKKKDLPSFA
jgi:hypothetical protein